MATMKNGAVTPAAYVAPSMELVEMGVEFAVLVASVENGTESYGKEEWDIWN